ncbi:MAG: c-type cytochrome biogenesis protein CcmI [Betaproteobacteria bacterium]|nr:c-type cytochrome biogenesis protein CcmI [Betaproteobacteria bacterium]
MTTFVVIAILLTVAVLALLLVPLLLKERKQRLGSSSQLSVAVLRDQLSDLEDQRKAGTLDPKMFAEEQAELERRALEDGTGAAKSYSTGRKLALAAMLGVGLPALVVGLYFMLGSPDAIKPQQAAGAGDAGSPHSLGPQQIQAMTAKLAERLQNNPDDGEGWLMLGRSYTTLGRYPEAAAAFGRATSLLPPNANLLANYADVMAMAQGRRLGGEPEKIIARALAIDPNHPKSLALMGTAAFERGDFAVAIQHWQKILTLVPPDSPAAKSIGNSIADAQRRMGGAPTQAGAVPGAVASAPASTAGSGAASVTGMIALAPELIGKTPANATLFVFARNTDGSRIPLAMARINAAKLPYSFKLDDSMSMMPTARLSSAKSVVIGARISTSGDAGAKPGDFEGFSAPVAVGTNGVKVTIGAVVK